MQAQIETETATAPSKRALLCRMKALLSAGTPTLWEQQELRTIEGALRRIDVKRPEHCQNCGKRIHV
jgi:RNA polymerase-binding transcription factor DksA